MLHFVKKNFHTFSSKRAVSHHFNKTKDWALVQTAALAINQGFNVGLGWADLTYSNLSIISEPYLASSPPPLHLG